jgi:hypothetical protein
MDVVFKKWKQLQRNNNQQASKRSRDSLNKYFYIHVAWKYICLTLQNARNSEGYNSEDINKGMGWTPRLTQNTNKQAEITLNQLRRCSLLSICQEEIWSEKSRIVAKNERLKIVPHEETAYKVLLRKMTNNFVRLRDAMRRTIPMMMAE